MAVRIKKTDNSFTMTVGGVACEPAGFFINYRGNRFGLRRGVVQVEKLEQRSQGEDLLGPWSELVATAVQPAKFIPPFRIVIKRYEKADVAVLHIEGDFQRPLFDADVVAGLSLKVPGAGPGYMTHLFMHEFKAVPPGYFFSTSTFAKEFPGDLEADWGNFAICQAGNGRYLALLPTVGSGMGARLAASCGVVGFVSTGLDGTKVYNKIPLGIIAAGRDPYRLVRDLFKAAKQATDLAFNLREEKEFPDIFKYFGWCSWNAFGQAVKADDLISFARKMREHHLPIGYVLIDDGWQSVANARLTGFDANPEKFPGGLAAAVSRLKNEFGVKYVGVWHTLQGYWDGIDPAAPDFAANPQWFWFGKNHSYCPNPLDGHGRAFMTEWYRRLRSWGIDFVKVDNQGGFREFFYNMIPQGEAMQKMQANLQNAARDVGMPIINCMEQHPECYCHYWWSNVGRANTDFFPEGGQPTTENRDLARRHLQDALYNSFWFQEIVHPDYDMFQTHHSAARCFAALNAISGGPVYTTDVPEKIDLPILAKLMNDDGTLLRPDQPARPCIECLTEEPMRGDVPLAAFAPVRDGAIVVMMNIGGGDGSMKASVSIKGLQIPAAPKYAVYSHFAASLTTATAAQSLAATLAPMNVEVISVVPIRRKFAAIGLVDRFVSPAAVVSVGQKAAGITVELTSPGIFGAYVGAKVSEVRCGGGNAKQVKGMPNTGEWSQKGDLLLAGTPSKRITIVF